MSEISTEPIWNRRWTVRAAGVAILIIAYAIFYLTKGWVPGNSLDYPLGWWGWFDQGKYLQSAKAFAALNFQASEHFYPPLYPLLGSLFIKLMPLHPFVFVDLAAILGYFAFLILIFHRYIGDRLTVLCGILGMVVYYDQAWVVWATPWTSTPGAFLIIGALYFLDRYDRLHRERAWTARTAAGNAAFFGLFVGLQLPNRPGDLLVCAPIALAYAYLAIRDFTRGLQGSYKLSPVVATAIAGILGFVVPVSLFALFNLAVYGSLGGFYFSHHAAEINFAILPDKLYSNLLDSRPFYAEPHDAWLRAFTPLFISILICPVALFNGPLVMRVASMSVLVQLVLYNSFSDLLPTGMFRFENIHYFKWILPILLCIAASLIVGAIRSGRGSIKARLSIGIWAFLFLVSMTIHTQSVAHPIRNPRIENHTVNITLGGGPIDFIDFNAVTAGWTDTYLSRAPVVLNGSETLNPIIDYRYLPDPDGGIRLLFYRQLPSGTHISINLDDKFRISEQPTSENTIPTQIRYRIGWW